MLPVAKVFIMDSGSVKLKKIAEAAFQRKTVENIITVRRRTLLHKLFHDILKGADRVW